MAAKDGDGYFESYADAEVHKLMLKDEPRTLAYRVSPETAHTPGLGVATMPIPLNTSGHAT